MTELGTLQPMGDDTYRLTFVRTLRHPVDKVWRAVTEAEHLAYWFPDGMQPDFEAGARLRFVPAGNDDLAFEGAVVAFEPPTLVEFTWGTDTIRIELAAADDGRTTVLTFTDTFDELGKAARDGAGWHAASTSSATTSTGRRPTGRRAPGGSRSTRRTSRRSDPRHRSSGSPTATRCPTERGVPTSPPPSRRG